MPKPDSLKWNTADAVALRTFIHTHPVFLDALKKAAPKVTGTTMEESALTGREKHGFDNCIKRIEEMRDASEYPTDNAGFIPNDKP